VELAMRVIFEIFKGMGYVVLFLNPIDLLLYNVSTILLVELLKEFRV